MLNPFQFEKRPTNPVTALVLSDDALTRLRVSERLRAAGCETSTFESGESALEWLDTNEMPNLLICDFFNPETEGVDFMDRARLRHGRTGLPPTLFLLDSPEDEVVAARYGVNDVLAKPISTTALFECLNALLAEQEVTLSVPKEFDDSEPAATSRVSRIPLIGRLGAGLNPSES